MPVDTIITPKLTPVVNSTGFDEKLPQDALTPNDLFEMLEKMGQPVKKQELERIGINYDFVKKTYSISLFYKKISRSRTTNDVKSVKNIQ